jgi:drug/metabolite transporter (DMT)-like permease
VRAWRHRAALGLATVFWGGTSASSKFAVEHLGPMTALVVELGVAVVVLWSILLVSGRRPARPGGGLVLLGVLEPGIAYGGLNFGLLFTSAANAALLDALEACFVVLIVYALLIEPVRVRGVGGLLLSAVGVLAVTGIRPSAAVGLGDALVVAGCLAAAGAVVLASRLLADADAVSVTAYQFAFGFLASLPLAGWVWARGGERLGALLDPRAWVVPAATGALGLAASFLLYNYAIRRVPVGSAGVALNLIPLFGLAGAALVLGEPLTVWHAVGAAAIIGGVLLFPSEAME